MSEEKWASFDAMKGIFTNLIKEGRGARIIRCSTRQMHTAVHKLAESEEYKRFFSEYIFDNKGTFPFSRSLETDLQNMAQAGLLGYGFEPSRYIIYPAMDRTFNEHTVKSFNSGELGVLERMAKEARALLD